MPPAESRRQRLRRELNAQILEAARRQLDEGGPGAVSWRGVAAEVGMNPASLYTYVDGLNDLITRLLVEAFESLATHVADSDAGVTSGDPRERLVASVRAYRSWAVANPRRFNLIFTDQVVGYTAPEDGPTVTAEMRVYAPMVNAIGELIGERITVEEFPNLPLDALTRMYGMFAALHGFVMLEINHHAPILGGSDLALVAYVTEAVEQLQRWASSRRSVGGSVLGGADPDE